MKSIQRRLLITIVIGTVVLPLEFGAVVYAILYDVFRDDPSVHLWRIPLPLALTALAASLIMIALAVHFIRAGLEPLNRFSDDLRRIDAESLDQRIDTNALPAELQSIGKTINALLKRLELAFERERRTTGNIAHELRTPIAELRTLTEVAQRSPEDTALTRTAVTEANAIALQMQRLVAVLLQLARSHHFDEQGQVETMRLAELMEAAQHPWIEKAQRKQIKIDTKVDKDISIAAHRSAIETILSNLISNAVTHCPEGGDISCLANVQDGCIAVVIENTNDLLIEEDLLHMSEPFWRKDAARSDAAHAGLGLTLVTDLCKACGYQLTLSLNGERFHASVVLPS